MTVMAPHESKMFEAMIQSLDPASGTAKVKFAKVSFRKKLAYQFYSYSLFFLKSTWSYVKKQNEHDDKSDQ